MKADISMWPKLQSVKQTINFFGSRLYLQLECAKSEWFNPRRFQAASINQHISLFGCGETAPWFVSNTDTD